MLRHAIIIIFTFLSAAFAGAARQPHPAAAPTPARRGCATTMSRQIIIFTFLSPAFAGAAIPPHPASAPPAPAKWRVLQASLQRGSLAPAACVRRHSRDVGPVRHRWGDERKSRFRQAAPAEKKIPESRFLLAHFMKPCT